MTIKEQVVEMAKSLPSNAGINDVRYRLMIIESVNKGIQEIDAGKGISHLRACEIIGKKWNIK